jgi:site-specific recombinase XerD
MLLHTLLQRITKLLNERKIKDFIATRKNISENTKLAYFYDLRAFINFLDNQPITQAQLNRFQVHLQTLANSSQHRKITNINIFLKYLYRNGDLSHFYELETVVYQAQNNQITRKGSTELLDLQIFYRQIQKPGDLIVLLILEFGLKPSDIQSLRWIDFDWEYKILTVTHANLKRILPIRNKFARLAQPIQNADELFSKSRQFLHYELKKVTPLTVAALREQYILQRVAENLSISDLAKNLGLKSIRSLEKYYL